MLRSLASTFPGGTFCGLDFSAGQLDLASRETRHLTNARCLLWDARLGLPDGLGLFDDLLSVYGALDFCQDPTAMLSAFMAGLRPGGMCSILTSTAYVAEAAIAHSQLVVERSETLASHRFVRARRTP